MGTSSPGVEHGAVDLDRLARRNGLGRETATEWWKRPRTGARPCRQMERVGVAAPKVASVSTVAFAERGRTGGRAEAIAPRTGT